VNGPVDWGPGAFPPKATKQRIEAEFALELQACRELERLAAERMVAWPRRETPTAKSEDAADELISLEVARSTKTYRAVLTLASTGYGEQAAMLNRSLFEGMAVAHWIHQDPPKAAAQYEDAARFGAHLAAELVERVEWTEDVDQDALGDAKLEGDELAEMKRRFRDHGDGLWTGHRSLRTLVRSTENQWGDEGRKQLWDFLEIAHRDNNQLLHSTVVGMHRGFSGHEPDGGRVWVGPSNVHIGEALFGAFWIYAQTLSLASDRFGFADPGELLAAIERHQHAFIRLTAQDVRGIGRNDPCPCESGRKFKQCHQSQLQAAGVV
jgi:hypothetical protein